MDESVLNEIIYILKNIPFDMLKKVEKICENNKELSSRKLSRKIIKEIGNSASINKIIHLLKENDQLNGWKLGMVISTYTILNPKEDNESIQLVWSGPGLERVPMRRTEQVIIELIQNAHDYLFIASFAVYKAKNVMKEIQSAIEKGILPTFLLETPESSHYKIKVDPFKVLPKKIVNNSKFLIWPYKNRKIENDEIVGTLHSKFIIQDDERVFISSANLTESALERNIELGVLITDKQIIHRLKNHIQELITSNVLTYINGK
jgi:phosphatidylserine/phosphatidylglycerophosphate/cardiolipin synthase-like enzyme